MRNLLDNSEIVADEIPYGLPDHYIEDGVTFLTAEGRDNIQLSIFGKHNLMNLSGARLVCERLNIPIVGEPPTELAAISRICLELEATTPRRNYV